MAARSRKLRKRYGQRRMPDAEARSLFMSYWRSDPKLAVKLFSEYPNAKHWAEAARNAGDMRLV
jgi:hypothetical protein